MTRRPFHRRFSQALLGSKQATHGVYIEIVVLAVIIALEGKRSSDADIVLSVFGALVAVVLAELYAAYLGSMIGTGRWPSRLELRSLMLGTGGALVAAVPPILVLGLGVTGVSACRRDSPPRSGRACWSSASTPYSRREARACPCGSAQSPPPFSRFSGSASSCSSSISTDGFPRRTRAGRPALRLDRAATVARGGARARRRGPRALPQRAGRRELAGLPGTRSRAVRAVRRLRRWKPRRQPHGGRRGVPVHDHERRQAVRLRPRVPADRFRGSAREARRERDGPPVQRPGLARADRRRTDEPDGERRRDRDGEPRARRYRRGKMGADQRRALALRGPDTRRERRRLRVGLERRTTETASSPACSRATTGSTSIASRQRISTRDRAASR